MSGDEAEDGTIRRRTLLAGTAAGLALGRPARAQAERETLRVAWRDAIPNLDFYYNPQRTGLIISQQVWDTLIYRDPETFQLRPQLALSWRLVDDTTIDFELRPGVVFQDGSKLSADDVVYTVELVLGDKQLAVPSNYTWIAGVEKLDELHVRLKLKRVFPAALEYLAMVLPIYPKAYRERVGEGFSTRPIGTGPYAIVDVQSNRRIDFVRNEAYFEGPKAKPAIKYLVINEVPDASSELDQLLNGQADWVWNVSADQLPKLAAMPTLQTATSESMRVAYLDMDAAGRTGADSPLTNQKVRQAILYALDRQTMAKQFMPAGSRVLDAPCYPTQFGCEASVATKYEYDPAKARSLLAEAGFKDGFDTVLVGYLLPPWMQALQGYLSAVGIRAKLMQLPISQVVQRGSDGLDPLEAGSWGSYSINDLSAFLPYFFDGGPHDYTRDPALTKLVVDAGATTDPDARRAAYGAAIRRMTEQAYFVPLFTYVTTYAFNKQLNFKPFRDELPRFYMASWK